MVFCFNKYQHVDVLLAIPDGRTGSSKIEGGGISNVSKEEMFDLLTFLVSSSCACLKETQSRGAELGGSWRHP